MLQGKGDTATLMLLSQCNRCVSKHQQADPFDVAPITLVHYTTSASVTDSGGLSTIMRHTQQRNHLPPPTSLSSLALRCWVSTRETQKS